MKVIWHEVDWEPVSLRVVDPQQSVSRHELDAFLRQFLEARNRMGVCKCHLHFLDVRLDGTSGAIHISCEWMCTKCLNALVEAIEATWPRVAQLEIGDPNDAELSVGPSEFARIPEQEVVFENGARVCVAEFSICRVPVSISEYEAFVHSINYLTTAELKGTGETFRNNAALGSSANVGALPATCISHHDAREYCRWNGTRLPTEAEWLAASIVDTNVYDDEDVIDQLLADPKSILSSDPRSLLHIGTEWTATPHGNGLVVRAGPCYARYNGWERDADINRFVWPADAFDIVVQFRVVRSV